MKQLVLVRHGESVWNREKRFSGWSDVDLSENGHQEAHNAGKLLKEGGYTFDIVFTSVLKRAIRTMWIIMDEMDLMWLPVIRDWHLNERHYGALQGLSKPETAQKHGSDQVWKWRRGYDIRPPPLEESDERHPCQDPKYKDVSDDDIPSTESLQDVVARVLPYWNNEIVPQIKLGKRVLIVGHGNSLRGLVKFLDNINEEDIPHFDDKLKPIKHHYLGDEDAIKEAMARVVNQAKPD